MERASSQQHPSPETRRWTSRRYAVVLIVVFNIAAALEIVHSKRVETDATELLLSALSNSSAYQVNVALHTVDLLLQDAAERLGADGSFSAADGQRIEGRIKAMPEVTNLIVLDVNGDTRFTVVPIVGDKRPNLADRDYFQYWRNHPDDKTLHIAAPYISRYTGRWLIPVSRPRYDTAGQFAGIVAAGLNPDFFVELLSAANNHETATGVLLMNDGTILARSPNPGDIIGKKVPSAYRDYSQISGFFFHLRESAMDGIARFIGLRRVGTYPLVVASTISEHEAMGSWRREMFETLGSSVPLSIAIFVIAVLADRREQEKTRLAQTVAAQRDELEITVAARTRDLNDLATRLAASNAELEQFAYVTSHDLQEPLRMIASYAQLIEKRYRDKLDARQFIDYMVGGVKRMQVLIADLLEYSRTSNQRRQFAEFESGRATSEALLGLSLALEESQGRLIVGHLPVVFGDQGQFRRLMQNLVGNAIKYRHPDRPPEIVIDAQPHQDGWHYMVADNGIGMESQYFERVFKMFQRLHTREQYEGTGIGLAICQKIVERHGGQIWVESIPGEGTTIHFTLPATNPNPS